MKDGCACLSCRIEAAIFGIIAAPDPETFRANAEDALPSMIPIMGVMLATLPAHELEPTWRMMLDARGRALAVGVEYLEGVGGRA